MLYGNKYVLGRVHPRRLLSSLSEVRRTCLSFRRPQNVAAVGGGVGVPVVVVAAGGGGSVVYPHVAPGVDGEAVVSPVDDGDIALLAQPTWPTKRGRATTPTAGGTR